MSEQNESETGKKYITAHNLKITFDDGTTFIYDDDGSMSNVTPDDGEPIITKKIEPFTISFEIVPYKGWWYPFNGIPGIHDN